MSKIKKLPEWFSLEKYKGTEHLKPREWGIEFMHRHRIREQYSSQSSLFEELQSCPFHSRRLSVGSESQKQSNDFFSSLHAGKPVTNHGIPEYEGIPVIFDREEQSLIAGIDNGRGVISPATFGDIFFNLEDDADIEDMFHDMGVWFERIDDRPKRRRDKSVGYVRVDFAATNALIKSDLDSIIHFYRDQLNLPEPTKLMTESKIRLFHQHRILAVLDLRLWAEIRGTSIPLELIGETVFSDRAWDDVGDNVRKTVNRLENLAKNPAYIKTLLNYEFLDKK
ncbi:DUF6387 family protein [Endozoicomonas montiporae]|nr:DUF6387 family protein [Endozoicomonas montiporae]AMO58428.1 hypothetical protein EZMO1_4515 [Endozoicomonas montiporae CL-33]